MKPYLIEGLDCSGKKAVAKQTCALLQKEGYASNIVVGPVCSKILQKFDEMLVNSFSIKPGSLRDKIRKATYAFEPVVDGMFYHETDDITLKVSSHYRAWARAIVEGDDIMAHRFQKYVTKHLKFSSATLLWTEFEKRILRHRADVANERTNKIESKRFFYHNSVFFDSWHTELRQLLENNIDSVMLIDTTEADIHEISSLVFHHIMEYVENGKN